MATSPLTISDRAVFRGSRSIDVVLDWLRHQILSGEYPPGSRLPAERELAEEMGITRHTLRSAIGRLEAEQLVDIRQGRGATVLDYRTHGSLSLVTHLVRLGQQTRELIRGFLDIRRSMGAEAIAGACERATEEELAELLRLAELQEQETMLDRFIERDIEFSRLTIRAARNIPMELIFNEVALICRHHPAIQTLRLREMDMIRPTYRVAVELIRQRDPDAARNVLRHFMGVKDAHFLEVLMKAELF